MCRHIYDWNIVNCDVKQPIYLIAWCFTSHKKIFQWRHRCAGRLKKLYLRSGSQRHRHFGGFFNVPVLHRHGATLFKVVPRNRPFYGTQGIRRTYSRLNPPPGILKGVQILLRVARTRDVIRTQREFTSTMRNTQTTKRIAISMDRQDIFFLKNW